MRMRAATAALLAAATFGVGACGDDDDPAVDNSVTPAATAPAPEPTATATTADAGATIQKLEISTDLKTKPTIAKPSGDPPTKLYSRDIVQGTGKAAKSGDSVSVQYVGVQFSDGEQFDASWDRGDPLEFRLGVGMVIQGWDEGIAGMKVGGRRRLTIPAHKAYGDRGAGGVIKPGATLVFVVDLVGVR